MHKEMRVRILTGTLRNTRNPIVYKMEAKILRIENDRLKFSYGEGQTILRYMKDQLELITFEGEET